MGEQFNRSAMPQPWPCTPSTALVHNAGHMPMDDNVTLDATVRHAAAAPRGLRVLSALSVNHEGCNSWLHRSPASPLATPPQTDRQTDTRARTLFEVRSKARDLLRPGLRVHIAHHACS